MTFSVKLNGFNTQAEAQAFLDWYGGQGEQDAGTWFECRVDEGEIQTTFMPLDYSDVAPAWNGNVLEATLTMFGSEEDDE